MSVPGGAALVIFLLAVAAGLWLSRVPPSLPPRVVVAFFHPEPAPEPVVVVEAPVAAELKETIVAVTTPLPQTPAEPEVEIAALAPEPEPEPQAEPDMVAPEPMSEPEPEPEIVAPEPEPTPESETVPEPESEPEIVASEPEPTPESEPVPEPESEPEIVAPEPEPAPESEPVPEPESEPEIVAPEPEPIPEPKPVPEPETAMATLEPVPAPEPVPEPEPEPEPPVTAEPEVTPDAMPEAPDEPAQATPAPSATWLAYARPFDSDETRPRIAVVVAGLGLGRAATAEAIKLPAAITLAFASYARDLQQWIDLARAAGHEVLLDLPMEPVNYPSIDPGPQPLLTTLSSAENVARLKWHLGRATGYVGVTHNMGSRFTASADDLRPILSALKVRGLMFLDARTSANSVAAQMAAAIGLPTAANDRFIDAQASRHAIDQRLGEIERIARATGYSVAVSHSFPVTLERLGRWALAVDGQTFVLAPISALANK